MLKDLALLASEVGSSVSCLLHGLGVTYFNLTVTFEESSSSAS